MTILEGYVQESDLVESLGDGRIRCLACGHRCPIPEGHSGVCKVRFNRGGKLLAPHGYVSGLQCDPIEKKPFYHVEPGAMALSFGTLGCSFHCSYCQNWVTSQSFRDAEAATRLRPVAAADLVKFARMHGARAVVSTYNEPLITVEWAVEVFRLAREEELLTGFVSNGSATPAVLDYLEGWLDLFKVDLKSFQDRHYRRLGGRLEPVLESIQGIHARGFWLEVVTLVVPDFNDSDEELSGIARFLASVSPDIPWHVTAFHPDYRMQDVVATPASTLRRAAAIGAREGLRFVYAGNLPGSVGKLEDTVCPHCRETLVERRGFRVVNNQLRKGGCCPFCGYTIAGRWMAPAAASARMR